MNSDTEEQAMSTEDKYIALNGWWSRYKDLFSTWYLNLSIESQKQILLKASPDMPVKSPLTKSESGTSIQPTDMLLPELNLDALLSSNGKIFLLFLSKRLTPDDMCFQADVLLLHSQQKKGIMPSFSNNNLANMDTPFIDPLDPEENVRTLSAETSADARKMVIGHLETGRLIHADAFICLKIRRAALVTFMEVIILECENAMLEKCNETIKNGETIFTSIHSKHVFEPNYKQLLNAELSQQEYFNNSENLLKNSQNQEIKESSTTATKSTSDTVLEEIS